MYANILVLCTIAGNKTRFKNCKKNCKKYFTNELSKVWRRVTVHAIVILVDIFQMQHTPLLVFPMVIYIAVMALFGVSAWDNEIFTLPMLSGGVFAASASDLLLAFGLVCLFFEVLKSTQFSTSSVINHMLSTLVTIAYLVVFLLVRGAETSLFFILMLMSLVDLMAGFSVSIRSATRDVAFGSGAAGGLGGE